MDFVHLTARDFVRFSLGAVPNPRLQGHLELCAECRHDFLRAREELKAPVEHLADHELATYVGRLTQTPASAEMTDVGGETARIEQHLLSCAECLAELRGVLDALDVDDDLVVSDEVVERAKRSFGAKSPRRLGRVVVRILGEFVSFLDFSHGLPMPESLAQAPLTPSSVASVGPAFAYRYADEAESQELEALRDRIALLHHQQAECDRAVDAMSRQLSDLAGSRLPEDLVERLAVLLEDHRRQGQRLAELIEWFARQASEQKIRPRLPKSRHGDLGESAFVLRLGDTGTTVSGTGVRTEVGLRLLLLVSQEESRPVRGARIFVRHSGTSFQASGETDSNGRFQVDLPPGRSKIEIEADGHWELELVLPILPA